MADSLRAAAGSPRHAAFVLLRRAGREGLTCAAILAAAAAEGLGGQAAGSRPATTLALALARDSNFNKLAVSTYTLAEELRPLKRANKPAARRAAPEEAPAAPPAGGLHLLASITCVTPRTAADTPPSAADTPPTPPAAAAAAAADFAPPAAANTPPPPPLPPPAMPLDAGTLPELVARAKRLRACETQLEAEEAAVRAAFARRRAQLTAERSELLGCSAAAAAAAARGLAVAHAGQATPEEREAAGRRASLLATAVSDMRRDMAAIFR